MTQAVLPTGQTSLHFSISSRVGKQGEKQQEGQRVHLLCSISQQPKCLAGSLCEAVNPAIARIGRKPPVSQDFISSCLVPGAWEQPHILPGQSGAFQLAG